MPKTSLKWIRTTTGRLLSEGGRFLIDGPYPIKAQTIDAQAQGPECRVTLLDAKGPLVNGRCTKAKYLCLTIIHAMAVATELVTGRNPWADL